MHIGILGGGTMGEIIIRAVLAKEVVRADGITVAELDPERRKQLAGLGVGVTASADHLVALADVLLICVKPQNAAQALTPLRGKLRPTTLAVSIMAGVSLDFLVGLLEHPLVVRSMPNLPARIGRGVTVWRPQPEVPDQLRVIARMIFQAFGREVEVESEDLLDAATAVSGTGPAYIFYIAENLLQAALAFGFDDAQALKLVRETFRGAMDLWGETGDSPAELRRQVTSKGGTTHAAVTCFQSLDIAGNFQEGVRSAYQRAKELARGATG